VGARANFVLIDEDGLRLHYSHWAADRVCSALVAGPDAASRFIAAQHLCDPERDWLDDIWGEGGAVVDHTTRRLVFFGDQLMLELPRKRAFMALLPLTWPGWTTQWAYDGVGDLAVASGVDRSVVRAPDEDERALPDAVLPDEWIDRVHLLTVSTGGGITAYPLCDDVHTAWQGPGLLDRLPTGGTSRLELPELPESGLHVDAGARAVGVWLTGSGTGLVPALDALWAGWHVEFWADRYEEQLGRCAEAVTVTAPVPDPSTVLDELTSLLTKRLGRDPVPAMLDLIRDSLGERSADRVELNPYITAHRQVDPTDEEWAAVLRAAGRLRTLDTGT
jgi:hypothetical protein